MGQGNENKEVKSMFVIWESHAPFPQLFPVDSMSFISLTTLTFFSPPPVYFPTVLLLIHK